MEGSRKGGKEREERKEGRNGEGKKVRRRESEKVGEVGDSRRTKPRTQPMTQPRRQQQKQEEESWNNCRMVQIFVKVDGSSAFLLEVSLGDQARVAASATCTRRAREEC